MKIATIGAGAIGSLIAAYLIEQGQDVTLIGKSSQITEMDQKGLHIRGVRGDKNIPIHIKERLDQPNDLVIVATKTQDLEEALKTNQEFLKEANILSTQNGIRADEIIADLFPNARIFSSIVMFGATYLAPGRVVHNFEGSWIIGPLDPQDFPLLEAWQAVFSKAFSCILTKNIKGMKWLKLFLNANNCLPAIVGKSMQDTFKNQDICRVSLQLWHEGWDMVTQAGIDVVDLPDFSVERLQKLMSMPMDQAAGIFSSIMVNLSKEPLYGSILQSIKRDRPSEIDFINGEFVRLAQSIGQSARLNEKIINMVHAVEKTKNFFSEEDLIQNTKEFIG